jgi:hypothetical protein
MIIQFRQGIYNNPNTWSPLQLTGLKAWYRADLGVEHSGAPATNGQTITKWKDQSGAGDANRDCSTLVGSTAPTMVTSSSSYNGLPVASCTNGRQRLNVSGGGAYTLLGTPTTVASADLDGAFVAPTMVLDGSSPDFVTTNITGHPTGNSIWTIKTVMEGA